MTPDDDECLRQIRRGGRERVAGISALFKAHAQPFKRYFIKHRQSPEDAEDMVQDTFVSIVRGAAGFRHDCPARIWLWTVAKNTLLMRVRKHKPDCDDIDEMADVLADPAGAQRDSGATLDDCVQDAFRRFGADHSGKAEVLTLATIHGWSTEELAAFLNRTLGATREYISQCRKFFKPYLEPCRDWLG